MSKLEDSIEAFTQAKAAAAAAIAELHAAKVDLDPLTQAMDDTWKLTTHEALDGLARALHNLYDFKDGDDIAEVDKRFDRFFAAMTAAGAACTQFQQAYRASISAADRYQAALKTRDRTKRQLLEAQQKLEPLIAATVAGIVGKD